MTAGAARRRHGILALRSVAAAIHHGTQLLQHNYPAQPRHPARIGLRQTTNIKFPVTLSSIIKLISYLATYFLFPNSSLLMIDRND